MMGQFIVLPGTDAGVFGSSEQSGESYTIKGGNFFYPGLPARIHMTHPLPLMAEGIFTDGY
jgi:hypothetical protein